jgi:iron complex outermembrane receptor protein
VPPSTPSRPTPSRPWPADGDPPAPDVAAAFARPPGDPVLSPSVASAALTIAATLASSAVAADGEPESAGRDRQRTTATADTTELNESGGERQILRFNDLGATLNLSPPGDYAGFLVNRNLIRGFANESSLRNGFRDFGALGSEGNTAVEGVEIYKGPASALYGNGKPGGDVNVLVRRPDGVRHRDAQLAVTKHGKRALRVDLSGGIDPNGDGDDDLALRLPFGFDVGEGWRRFNRIEAYSTAPSFAWRPTARTRLMVETDFLRVHEQAEPQRVPLAPLMAYPERLSLGEQHNWYRERGRTLRTTLEHAFSDRLRLRQALFVQRTRTDLDAAALDVYGRTGSLLSDDGTQVRRVVNRRRELLSAEVSQTELYGLFNAFGIAHQVLVGVELGHYRIDTATVQAPLAALDLVNPVYGAQPGAFTPYADQLYRNRTSVLYLQDRMWISQHWQALVGLRAEQLRASSDNRLLGQSFRGNDSLVSPRLGLVWSPTPTWSWFASWTQSSQPQLGAATADGAIVPPEEGRQLEAGLQWRRAGGGLLATMSVYRLDRRNLAAIDPNNPDFFVPVGERNSRGVEFELRGSPVPGTDIDFNIELLRARVVNDSEIPAGTALPGVAPWFFTLWATHQVKDHWVLGWGLVGEGRRRGGLPPNELRLPSYVTADLSLAYRVGGHRVQLGVGNVLGRRVLVTDGYAGQFIEPRAVTLTFSGRQ